MSLAMDATTLATITRVADLADHQSQMARPLVGYRRVAPAARSPAPPPAFLFGPSGADLARQLHGQIETPEIGVASIADAAIGPTGIGLRDGVAFSGAALNQPPEHVAGIVARLNETRPPCRTVPGPLVPLFGPGSEDPGQVLIDYLPRLWLLDQAGYPPDTLYFMVPDHLPGGLVAVVQALGIPPDRLVRYAHWREVIRTDLLLLPTILRRHQRLSPAFGPATRFWTAHMRRTLGLPAPEPLESLYIRDPNLNNPVLRNGARIEAIAERRGYRIAVLDRMGLAERAALLSRAGRIVGPCAPALRHSVFAAPGAIVCAMRGTEQPQAALQTGLCHALDQRCGLVFGPNDAGGFTIDETNFRRALDFIELPQDETTDAGETS